MLPLIGGSSVVRESIVAPAEVADAAHRLVEEIGLDGYSRWSSAATARDGPS